MRSRSVKLPVLVVDDSALARKVLIHLLAPDWDIDITQATNGVEGLKLKEYRLYE
jgi:two-component system chemotaxis response regulator CheY